MFFDMLYSSVVSSPGLAHDIRDNTSLRNAHIKHILALIGNLQILPLGKISSLRILQNTVLHYIFALCSSDKLLLFVPKMTLALSAKAFTVSAPVAPSI